MSLRKRPPLSDLENQVMRIVWDGQRATADEVRGKLAAQRRLKDSTIRTVLRRLERKGYVTHVTEGRTYIYVPKIDSSHAAAEAVRTIIDRFCDGSVEALLVGMVDDELVAPEKLRQLADRISRAESGSEAKQKKGRSR